MKKALLLLSVVAFAADPLVVTRERGNDNVELSAKLILDPEVMRQEVNGQLDSGFVVVRVAVTNKTGDPIRVSPGDFVLLSRKNGERADAMAPGQVAGGAALVVNRDRSAREFGSLQNTQGITGVAGMSKDAKPADADLLASLKAKELPDGTLEGKGPLTKGEGLLYFSMDTKKLKSKDLSLIFASKQGGRLVVDFK